MADDALRQRGKGLEEEYFHRKEKELIEKLRKQREAEAQTKELAEATGNPNEEILKTLQELGYLRETVSLLHLVPLLNVAWADNRVSNQERDMILEAARLHGVTADNPGYPQLTDWLNNRPSQEFFEHTLRIIGDLLEITAPGDRKIDRETMLDLSTRIAAASGGILGVGKISGEEQAALDRLAAALEKRSRATQQ
jgi:hypothetical protein